MGIADLKAKHRGVLLGWASCAGVVSFFPMGASLAAEDDGASFSLETVTVTAQRREEDSQSVPIVINTVSGEDAALRGAFSFQNLAATVPNLSLAMSGASSNMYIRGVGSNNASSNNEPSVATYVDGVYMPSSIVLTSFQFNKIERLEVLKGPQGTLFGRNATAGVIQIITPDPQQEFGGDLTVGYGNYETQYAQAYLTGAVTENLTGDVAAFYEDQNDGWGYNLTVQKRTFLRKTVGVRNKWLYTPSDSTSIRLAADYVNYASDGGHNSLAPGSRGVDGYTVYAGRYNSVSNALTLSNTESLGASMRIDQDLGPLHGVSITSFRNMDTVSVVDNDVGPEPRASFETHIDGEYWTQEFQLSARNPGRIDWLAGLFLYDNTVNGVNPRFSTGSSVAGGYRETYGTQKTKSGSVYGQATAEIFADTKLTLGLRYTDERLEATGRNQNRAGQIVTGPFSNEIDFNPWTWRIALDHQFTPDVLGYVSYNRGFKSGGYNLPTPGSAPFLPEQVDAYEVGVKSELLDNRLRINAGLFYYDYQDMQVSITLGGGTGAQVFTNAAAARNYGLDLNADFAATENLTLSAGLGLLRAEFEDYPNVLAYTILGQSYNIPNAKGNDLPNSPPYSGFVAATYSLPTSVGEFKVATSLAHTARAYVSADEGYERPAYYLLTSTLEWWSNGDKPIGVQLWGRNLTNSTYPLFATSSANGWYRSNANPRTYGLKVTKRF